ncbi:DUF3958 family protein [Enterococcus sp. AZ192]|uniref:DUF3958 family protein n=1 Tax=unclassified Enterococcus TaxID=2608891 RepID=UPI003D27B35D
MSKLEEIQLEKTNIEREKDEIEALQRNMNQTAENYEEYFFYQKQLFSDLQEDFAQSQTGMLYQDMSEEINWQNRGIQDFLEEQQQEIKKQTRELEDKQEELYWQELKSKEEMEDAHEY